jgi:LytR cell envelope-related transcriptional attenuator
VEHAVPFEAVRPWRTAAIVASSVAAVELLVLIVAGTIMLGHSVAGSSTAATKPAASKTAHAKPARPAILTRAKTRVAVLNANGLTGAAAAEAQAVRARGYRIGNVGNAPQSSQGPTILMYRPGFAAEAKRLGHDTGISTVTALDGMKPASLGRAQLVIVLGSS